MVALVNARGIRERAMLLVALTDWLCVSDLVGILIDELVFSERYLHLVARGRSRLGVRGDIKVLKHFFNARPEPMSRSVFEGVLERTHGR